MKVSKIRSLAAKQLAKSDGVVLGAAATNVVNGIWHSIQYVVPSDFYWWMEMDSGNGISVRWVWLGHSAVSHIGGVKDSDITILLALLRDVNWFVERDDAIESVEGYEREALRIAQERRRMKAVGPRGGKLKTVEIPEPPAFTLEGKRLVHRVGLARAGYEAAASEKARKEAAKAALRPARPPIHTYRGNAEVPEHGLTRSDGTIIKHWTWEAYHEKEEMMETLCAEPPGTYTHLTIYGNICDHPDAWREAWISTRATREEAARVEPEPSWPAPDQPRENE